MNLKITQLKPNPTGKDTTALGPSVAQLAAEWVDIKNEGAHPFDLRKLHLYHRAYSSLNAWEWAPVVEADAAFTDILHIGQTLRVHSGRVRDVSVIPSSERAGADRHGFTGRDWYIWNNANPDEAAIWDPAQKQFRDRAEYTSFPPEGVVLVRSGNLLVPGFTLAALAGFGAVGGRR
jgi:hypothetical protein